LTSTIRLIGGTYAGRVEALCSSQWLAVAAPEAGTVAGRAARSLAAAVVCRQMGLMDGAAVAEDPPAFGMTRLSSWLNLTNSGGGSGCPTGMESSVLDCTCSYTYEGVWSASGYWTTSTCNAATPINGTATQLLDYQLTVSCPPPSGKTAGLGCRQLLNRLRSLPACAQMWRQGCSLLVSFGRSWLGWQATCIMKCDIQKELQALQQAAALPSCPRQSTPPLSPFLSAGLPFVPLRLTGSVRAGAGRLEIWANDTWAAVASTAATANATRWSWVVSKICQDLGFLRGASFAGNLFWPPGSMPQWRSVACSGNETSALACVWGSLISGSSATQDVNVVCTNAASGKLAQAVQHAHT